jgi:hypothetical protein
MQEFGLKGIINKERSWPPRPICSSVTNFGLFDSWIQHVVFLGP